MLSTLNELILLGQFSNWERLGDGLHRSGPRMEMADLIPVAVVLALLAVAAVVAVKVYKRNDFSKPCNDADKLFRQLCFVHGLNGSNRKLLVQLAEAWQMSTPATLFVTPAAFRATDLPDWLQSEAERIKQLAQKLF